MKKYLLPVFFLSACLYGQDVSAQRLYEELQRNHAGGIAAKSFNARLSSAGARKLLRDKISGTNWYVDINYNLYTGISFKVKGTDPFYENTLSQYEVHINEMLLPLLATRGYERLKDSFIISSPKQGVIQVAFKKGDKAISYIFKVGVLGLIDRLDYYEGKVRKYAIAVRWEKTEGVYVPGGIKSISYEGTRTAGDFELVDIKILEK